MKICTLSCMVKIFHIHDFDKYSNRKPIYFKVFTICLTYNSLMDYTEHCFFNNGSQTVVKMRRYLAFHETFKILTPLPPHQNLSEFLLSSGLFLYSVSKSVKIQFFLFLWICSRHFPKHLALSYVRLKTANIWTCSKIQQI